MEKIIIQGILVDPALRSVRLVDIPKKDVLSAVYGLIDADTVDVVRAEDFFGGTGGAFLYVDDVGLFRPNQAFTLVNQTPVAGKFVILREVPTCGDEDDEDAWLQGVDFTVDAVHERIRFISQDVAQTVLERGTLAAAAAYVARDLHVERHGTTLFVTPKEN